MTRNLLIGALAWFAALSWIAAPASAAPVSARSDLALATCYKVFDFDGTNAADPVRKDRSRSRSTYFLGSAFEQTTRSRQELLEFVSTEGARLGAELSASPGAIEAEIRACETLYPDVLARIERAHAARAETERAEKAAEAERLARTNREQCDITERRATGIMDTWRYAYSDYATSTIRDYAKERELSELYRNLYSRLTDEGSVAEVHGCTQLLNDIRFVLADWKNPY